MDELAQLTEALTDLEVRRGCFGEVERPLAALRQTLAANRTTYQGKSPDDVAERVWINLLRLGFFEELRQLINRNNLPVADEVQAFIEFCSAEYARCSERGRAYRARFPDNDIFVLGCIVWGDEYVGNFLRYNLRSMLAAGNLPALHDQGEVVLSVVTDAAGEAQIRRDPVFAELSAVAEVEFITIPADVIRTLRSGHLVRNFYILYGMLDHCSIYFAQEANAHLFMIPVDSIVANGSLSNMAAFRHQGFDCCGGGNIVANTETFLPALRGRYGDEGPMEISTEALASLAVEHAHHYFQSQVLAKENTDFGKHPRELFWPRQGGIEIHSVFIHPLFTSAAGLSNYKRKHFANIDYGMIPRMFATSERIKIIEDPRLAYVNNFTATNRLYETTGRPYAVQDFVNCHDWTYPIQKSLFGRAQVLPCRQQGWTAYRNIKDDVEEIVRDLAKAPKRANSMIGLPSDLTIVLATRNRVLLCEAQLRMFRAYGARHRVIVADSSDQPSRALQEACTGAFEYRHFPPSTPAVAKWASVVHSVMTPYVAIVPDDDVTFPRAIDVCADFLRSNADYAVAQGYVLDFSMKDSLVDINSMRWAVPGSAGSTPLHRLYEVMRRYQPFFSAVFRKEAYLRAIDAAMSEGGVFFQEIRFAATIALLAKSKRLPLVHMMRGTQESTASSVEKHPLIWFLKDAGSFFSNYAHYRQGLLDLVAELEGTPRKRGFWEAIAGAFGLKSTSRPQSDGNAQTVDMIHAAYLGREIDLGRINHTARTLLGDEMRDAVTPSTVQYDLTERPGDLKHRSSIPLRHYVWRRNAITSDDGEFSIDASEITSVEAALEDYWFPSVEELQNPRDMSDQADRCILENLGREVDGECTTLLESPTYGYHRILLAVSGVSSQEPVTSTFVVKPAGCRFVKVELHTGEGDGYATATFDLKDVVALVTEGPVIGSNIQLAEGGFLKLSLDFDLSADSDIHVTFSLLNAECAVAYVGRGDMALLLRKIIVNQPSWKPIQAPIENPSDLCEGASWGRADNLTLQNKGDVFAIRETMSHGYHRISLRSEGAKAQELAIAVLSVKTAGCRTVRLELHGSGSTDYVAADFDLASGTVLSAKGARPNAAIQPAGNGFFTISVETLLTSDSTVILTVGLFNQAGSLIYAGHEEQAVELRRFRIDRIAPVHQVLEKPTEICPVAQWGAVDNLLVERGDSAVTLSEIRSFGFHRMLLRTAGGKAGQLAMCSFQVEPAGSRLVKIELHGEGAGDYASATFDVENLAVLSSASNASGGKVSARDGVIDLSLDLLPTADTRLFFTLSLLNKEGEAQYIGGDGGRIVVRSATAETTTP